MTDCGWSIIMRSSDRSVGRGCGRHHCPRPLLAHVNRHGLPGSEDFGSSHEGLPGHPGTPASPPSGFHLQKEHPQLEQVESRLCDLDGVEVMTSNRLVFAWTQEVWTCFPCAVLNLFHGCCMYRPSTCFHPVQNDVSALLISSCYILKSLTSPLELSRPFD